MYAYLQGYIEKFNSFNFYQSIEFAIFSVNGGYYSGLVFMLKNETGITLHLVFLC